MKSVLTHLAAALAAGLLVFLIWGRAPRDAGPADSGQQSTKSSAPPENPRSARSARLSTSSGAPADATQSFDSPEEEDDALLRRLDAHVPSRAELMDYIAARNHDPEAIFAAALILDDLDLLREAARVGADRPHILAAAAANARAGRDERMAWSTQLLELEPRNALASYLVAARHLEADDLASALAQLRKAATQPDFEDHFALRMLAVEEAYRGTGSSAPGAKLASTWNALPPHTLDLVALTSRLDELRAESSPEDAQDLRRMNADIGVRMAEDPPTTTVVSERMGLAIQAVTLSGLPNDAASPFENLTVAEARTSLDERHRELRQVLLPDHEELSKLPPHLAAGYADRVRLLGEYEATRWLRSQTVQPNPTPDP